MSYTRKELDQEWSDAVVETERLRRRVDLEATGATIHNLRNKFSVINDLIYLWSSRGETWTDIEAEERLEWWNEARLHLIKMLHNNRKA